MFHAIRQWWGGGRGKVTLRLFLFEFLVVVAGVLTAQALASWGRPRRAAHTTVRDGLEPLAVDEALPVDRL